MKRANEAGSRGAARIAEKKVVRADAPRPGEDERRRQIAEAAYFRALARDFAPGHETEDWLEAESEVDCFLQRA